MSKEHGYYITIKEGDKGEDTEAFIRAALDHPRIAKWAYIKHDKEFYTESDLRARRYGLMYSWADGFPEMEKYSSRDEYIEEYMQKPPFVGDKLPEIWFIVCIAEKKSCGTEDIAEYFGVQESLVSMSADRCGIARNLRQLTQEDRFSRTAEKHLYPDSEVRSNFDFRSYIDNTIEHPKREKWKRIFSLPPVRQRKDRKKETIKRILALVYLAIIIVLFVLMGIFL